MNVKYLLVTLFYKNLFFENFPPLWPRLGYCGNRSVRGGDRYWVYWLKKNVVFKTSNKHFITNLIAYSSIRHK